MGMLREVASGATRVLEPEHFVGRTMPSGLRLKKRYVSAQHALLRWNDIRWELKDLASRNGTFLDGQRIKPSEERPLCRGSIMAFGALEEQWELIDDSPPKAMVVPLDEGEPVLIEGDLLALPSADDPHATIYRIADGSWVLEQPSESATPITNLQTFDLDGRAWRFCCVENMRTTVLAVSPYEMEVRHLQLVFFVSRDEEFVQLQLTCGAETVDLGSRGHNYLLLTLARQRLADAGEALPDPACGWVYQEDLAHDPTMAPPQLNIDVHRIRKQFAEVGVLDAANIVERRPRTRQLRIGTGRLSIVQL